MTAEQKQQLKKLKALLTVEDPGIRVVFDVGMFHVEAMPGGIAYNTWPGNEAIRIYWAIREGLMSGIIELTPTGRNGYRVTGVKI